MRDMRLNVEGMGVKIVVMSPSIALLVESQMRILKGWVGIVLVGIGMF